VTDVEYLCNVHVRDATNEVLHVYATVELLIIDKVEPRKPEKRERIRSIELEHIASIEVDAIRDESHSFGWKPTTGFLNSGTTIGAVSGVLVVLDDGEHILWRIPNMAPIEVKAAFGRLIHAVNGGS